MFGTSVNCLGYNQTNIFFSTKTNTVYYTIRVIRF
jgi:hypothetical protein